MEHLIFLAYVLLFSSGFAGIASLAYLRLKLRGASLPYFIAIQSVYLAGLGFQAVLFYFRNLVRGFGSPGGAGLTALRIGAGAAGAALYWLAWAALRSEGLFRRTTGRRCSFLFPAVSAVLASTAVLMSAGVAAAAAGRSLGLHPVVSYLPATVSILAAGMLLALRAGEFSHPAHRLLFRLYGIALLGFVPLTFLEAALEYGGAVPYKPLSLDFVFFFLWNCAAVLAAYRSLAGEKGGTARALVDDVPDSFAARFALSPREREMILLIARGLPNKGIAAELGISPSTVRTHIYNLFQKVGARSRIELLALMKAASE